MSQCNNLKCYFAILFFETICIPLNTHIVKCLCMGFRARCKTIPECLWLRKILEVMMVVVMVGWSQYSLLCRWETVSPNGSAPAASDPVHSGSCIAALMGCMSGKLVCKKCIIPKLSVLFWQHTCCVQSMSVSSLHLSPANSSTITFSSLPKDSVKGKAQHHLPWIDLTWLGGFLSQQKCLISSWNQYVKLSHLLYLPELICKDTVEEEKYKQIWCCCCAYHN